jgi:hypothetical protein
MIAIARKRKQNSAYTTNGEARAGFPIRASTFFRRVFRPYRAHFRVIGQKETILRLAFAT